MKDKIYILFNRNGVRSLVKKTKTMKYLPSGTYMAELNLEVNDEFFNNRVPKFNIKLEDGQIVEPEIEVEGQAETPLSLFFSRMDNK